MLKDQCTTPDVLLCLRTIGFEDWFTKQLEKLWRNHMVTGGNIPEE
jgi:hypothetical protein